MRLGIVRGHMTLNLAVESYRARTLAIIEPVTMENLRANEGIGGGKALIAIDELGAANGQMVAFTEGGEAANPFWPGAVPVDAYCALIVDSIHLRPQEDTR
ncbi:MAG: EutN/CcmL family microcompartment protein [Terracidiphilus sp.]